MSAHASLALDADAGCVALTMPPDRPLRRIGSLRLEGWLADAEIVDVASPRAAMQLNGASRGGRLQPVAVRLDPWRWLLYPATTARLASLTAVDENDFTVDDRAFFTPSES